MGVTAADIDKADNVNAFLAMIGRARVPADYYNGHIAARGVQPDSPETKQNLPYSEFGSDDSSPGVLVGDLSEAISPARGSKAPPPTPASRALTLENLHELDRIQENHANILTQLADQSELTLLDTKHARKVSPCNPSKGSTTTGGQLSPDLLKEYRSPKKYTSAQFEVMEKIAERGKMEEAKKAQDKNATSMTDRVIADFKKNIEISKENLSASKYAGKVTSNPKSTDTIHFPPFRDQKINTISESKTLNFEKSGQHTGSQNMFLPEADVSVPSSPTSAGPAEVNKDHAAAVDSWGSVKNTHAEAAEYDWGHVENTKAEVVTSTIPKTTQNSTKAELAFKVADLGITVKTTDVVGSGSKATELEEDREHATHFNFWGTPTARDKPAARVRKIILSNLPAGTDLTLVQSLIHGGAIDNFTIIPSGTVAHVTFTTGDACDKFHDKYPNGMTFKYKGKNQTVFVQKDKDVNIISGVLQGHLECRASRCVRATGADEDWSYRALQKLAEGKNRKGKVEGITDTWRQDLRTIAFHFTNISDAVAFKAMLVRDEEWEHCNIQFMDDPCEAATSVHFE